MFTIGKIVHSFVKSQRCSYGITAYPELQEYLRAGPEMSALLTSLSSVDGVSSELSQSPILLLKEHRDFLHSPSASTDDAYHDERPCYTESASNNTSHTSIPSPRRDKLSKSLKSLSQGESLQASS